MLQQKVVDKDRVATLAGRTVSLGRLVIAIGVSAVAASALAVQAQAQNRDSVTIRIMRAVTPFEIEVERLARELIERRNIALRLNDTRQRLLVSLRKTDIGEGERTSVANSLRGVEVRLADLESDRNNLRRALDDLCSARRQPDGWMGITFTSEYTLSAENNITVTHFRAYPSIESVEPNSPAERAGVQRGDILLSLDGRDLRDAEVVFGELLKPGARLALKLKRGVDTKTLSVLIEPSPSDFEVPCAWVDETLAAAMAPMPGAPVLRVPAPGSPGRLFIAGGRFRAEDLSNSPLGYSVLFSSRGTAVWAAGANIIPLNEDLGQLVSVDRGVFVVEVIPRSPAAQSGLRSGDVIVSAQGSPITTPQALREIMNDTPTKEVSLQVMRMKKAVNVVLKW